MRSKAKLDHTGLGPGQDHVDLVSAFDRQAASYAEGYEGCSRSSYFFRTRQQLVLRAIEPYAGRPLLDVGCGPGMMVAPCRERGFQFTGVDVSPGMIRECVERHGRRSDTAFHVGRVQKLPFVDSAFMVVLCMGVLEYLQVAERSVAVEELFRVTAPNGILVLSCLNGRGPFWMWRSIVGAVRRMLRVALLGPPPRPRFPRVRFFTRRGTVSLLQEAGFLVRAVHYFGFDLLPERLFNRLPRLSTHLSKVLERLATSPMRWFGRAFLVVATKPSGDKVARSSALPKG
jgi:2-polyprenyl-3-methyl-5-hydroxy-6-metoxy-1,4-benzoquinol methylase